MPGTILALKEVSWICTKAAVKKWLYRSLLLFQGRIRGFTSEFSMLQWPDKPCPLGGYRNAVRVLSWSLGKGHLEVDIFMGLTRGLASVRVSDECHWDHTTRCALLFSCSSTYGFVLHQSWCDTRLLAKGAAIVSWRSLLCFHCCTFTAACVVGLVVFWPQDKSVQLNWLCRKQIGN